MFGTNCKNYKSHRFWYSTLQLQAADMSGDTSEFGKYNLPLNTTRSNGVGTWENFMVILLLRGLWIVEVLGGAEAVPLSQKDDPESKDQEQDRA